MKRRKYIYILCVFSFLFIYSLKNEYLSLIIWIFYGEFSAYTIKKILKQKKIGLYISHVVVLYCIVVLL